jgi:hypothetical protein
MCQQTLKCEALPSAGIIQFWIYTRITSAMVHRIFVDSFGVGP